MPSLPHPPGRSAGVRPALAGAVAAVAWAGGAAWLWRDYFLDDAFITLRTAANLAAGRGPVFNPGERVEAITNLGWALLLAPAGGSPAAAKLLGLGAALATLALLTLAALRLAGRPPAGASPGPGARALLLPLPLLVAASPDWLYPSLAGMETAAVSALLALALVLAAGGAWRWPPALLCALLYSLRPEAVLVWPLFAAALVAGRVAGWRRLVAPAALVAGGVGGLTLWRLVYFGSPLPNTFFAKPGGSGVGERLLDAAAGTSVNLPPPFAGVLLPLFGGYGLWRLWRRSPPAAAFTAAAVVTGVIFALYAPDDWTGTGRYFGPYLPLAWLALWWGIAAAVERLFGGERRRTAVVALTAAAAALLVAAGAWRGVGLLGWEAAHSRPGYIYTAHTLIAPARRIAAEVPADATIATRRLGVLGWVSHRRLFDYAFGLTDRDVARAIRRRGDVFPDPRHPALAAAWRRRAPGYLLEDLDLVEEQLRPGESLDRFTVHGISYRLLRRYPIGDGHAFWALCERLPEPAP